MRPPRVQITHDVETNGSLQKKELPFIVGIISDLAGETVLAPIHERKFIFIDGDNFNGVMSFIAPTIKMNLEGEELELKFNRFSDFSPDSLVQAIPALKTKLDQRIALTDLAGKLDGNFKLEEAMLGLIANPGDSAAVKAALKTSDEHADAMIAAFTCKLGANKDINNVYQFTVELIAALDAEMSADMCKVLHNPKFQALESSWRGMYHLVSNAACGEMLKLRVLSASRKDLEGDLYKCPSFDLSKLFKLVYEEEYGTPGGQPYSCLLVDLYFGKSNPDVELLRKLSEVASAAHAPMIAGTSAKMFGVDSFREMARINDIKKIFEGSEAAKFKGLRDTEEARYVALPMARVLARAPYHPESNPIDSFKLSEAVNNDEEFSWMNPAYCLSERIVNAYTMYGWVAAIRGVEGGGLIENLPQHLFKTEQGDTVMYCPTEISITDRKERELSDLGFLPICHIKDTDKAVIFGGQTIQKSKLYLDKDATANATVSARLPYVMNASRFAHYVKVMMRDKIGSSMTAGEVEQFLQDWLADYILLSENASLESKARLPLKDGKVQVVDDPERPGSYKAIMWLQPHFQMEDLSMSIRIVAKIPVLEG
jgi:type VI secretion system protein ImpC